MYIKRQTKQRETINFKETTIQINRDDKQRISPLQITNLYNSVLNQNPDARIRIRALGITRWTTLSTYDRGLMIEGEEEYWDGKDLDDPDKFTDFAIIQMTVYVPK